MSATELDLSRYKLGWSDEEDYVFKPRRGLDEDIIREMSWMKGEPDWMLKFRLKSYQLFLRRPMPNWGGDMSEIFFDDIYYYIKPTEKSGRRLGRAARVGQAHLREAGHPRGRAQVPRRRHRPVRVRGRLPPQPRRPRAQGVIFCDMDTALREHPEIVKAYFGTDHPAERQQVRRPQLGGVVAAARSSTSRPGVEVEMPLQAYFRINAENMGQFERTLIIADEGSKVHYIEGCSAPVYTTDSLHSAVVEIDRQAVGPGHLHDHPELVEQRLQPGHQAGQGRGRGPHGVDRRQHRLPPHHEVPGRRTWSARRRRARCCRSPTPARASTRTPAPRWCTPRPRPPRRSCPSPSRRTAAAPATAASSGSRTTPTAARATCSATPSSSTRALDQRHLPLHGGR